MQSKSILVYIIVYKWDSCIEIVNTNELDNKSVFQMSFND